MDVQMIVKVLMLVSLVGASAYVDIKERRIPNKITVPFALAGVLVSTVFDFPGGLTNSLIGFLFGFVIFFIPYLMGAMGAGDIKLMAAIGAITNMDAMLYVTIFTTLVGGVIIIVVRLKQRQMINTLKRMGKLLVHYFYAGLYMVVKHPMLHMKKEEYRLVMTDDMIDFIPYGVAIAGGTIITIGLSVFEIVPGLYL